MNRFDWNQNHEEKAEPTVEGESPREGSGESRDLEAGAAESEPLVERPGRRALILETDPFLSERLRYMIRAEDFSVCAVDEWPLFRTLVAQGSFGMFAVSGGIAVRAGALELLRKLDPLLVLVSAADGAEIARLRMALPTAALVDRALRDPDAVRRALGTSQSPALEPPVPRPSSGPAQQWVRAAFEAFALSERQLEVLARALRGETSREIAARLYISEPTVRNHLHAIYERLGVSGRRELLGRFVRGLIDPGSPPDRGPQAKPFGAV